MPDFFELPFSNRFINPVHADSRTGPWVSVAEACQMVPREARVIGLPVVIRPAGQPATEYWWSAGLEDTDLVPHQAAEAWQPLTPQELPTAHQAAAGLSQRATILYLFQNLGAGSGDYGYAWLTEDEQLIVTEDAE